MRGGSGDASSVTGSLRTTVLCDPLHHSCFACRWLELRYCRIGKGLDLCSGRSSGDHWELFRWLRCPCDILLGVSACVRTPSRVQSHTGQWFCVQPSAVDGAGEHTRARLASLRPGPSPCSGGNLAAAIAVPLLNCVLPGFGYSMGIATVYRCGNCLCQRPLVLRLPPISQAQHLPHPLQ